MSSEPAPAPDVQGPWYSLNQTFIMERGDDALPRPHPSRVKRVARDLCWP